MEIINTQETKEKPPVHMVIYGEGGVGKTTLGAKAPNAIIADCESGTKYLGSRGIDVDVAKIQTWTDFVEFVNVVKESDEYDSVVIDPIGELMDKLKQHMIENKGSKLVQRNDDSPTMAGWGWLKKVMRRTLKGLRDSGMNVVVVAHVEEERDDNRIVKRPMMQTKLSEELVNMVDIVAYMTVIEDPDNPEGSKRVLICDPESDRYIAKDRTGQLSRYTMPEWHHTTEDGEKVGILDLVYQGDWSEEEDKNPKVDTDTTESDESDLSQNESEKQESLEDVEEEMKDEEEETSDNPLTEINIAALGLPTRTENSLLIKGITNLQDLTNHTVEQLRAINDLGEKGIEKIKEAIDELDGVELADDEDNLTAAQKKLAKHNN